jgi:UDP-GlcNAc:undecaprenyl-phosphate/decaprenyl-phosphate GlcNAc-1-phosphate transferase
VSLLSSFQAFDPTIQKVLDNLGPGVPVFALALGVALVLSWVAIRVSPWVGMMKLPNRERDIHARPIPMLGGVALFGAFAGAVLLLMPSGIERNAVLGLCGGAALLFLVDDRYRLPAWVKLAGQILIALTAILGFGHLFQITFFSLPKLGLIQTGWFALPLTLFWLLGMQNTINLIDGVDGLAGGVVAIVALTLMVAAASIGQFQVVILAAALAGACAGYLFFNFNPARLFMADSGAHFLGMALGLLSVMGVAKLSVAFALAIPVLALAVPIADTAWSIIRRRLEGVSLARADAKHIHHRLLDFGLSQRETCLLFYGATGILGAVGLTVLGHRRVLLVAILVMVALLLIALAERVRMVRRWLAPSLRGLMERRELR